MKINVLFATLVVTGAASGAVLGGSAYISVNPTPPANEVIPCNNSTNTDGISINEPAPRMPDPTACAAVGEQEDTCNTGCINIPGGSKWIIASGNEPCDDPSHVDCITIICTQRNYSDPNCTPASRIGDTNPPTTGCR